MEFVLQHRVLQLLPTGKELDIQYLGLHYEFYIKDLTQHLVIKALDIQEINLHKLGLQ